MHTGLVSIILIIFLVLAPVLYLFAIIRHFRNEIKHSRLEIILFIILTAVFLNKLLFFGQTLAQQDFNNIQVTLSHFYKESITNHLSLPIWNTRFGGGFDAFSNPLSVYFSPFSFLFLLFPDIYTGFNIFIFFQILFILIFSYLSFRGFGFNKGASFLGSILFTFNGFLTMRLSPDVGIEYLFSIKWIPLAIYFVHKYLTSYEKKYIVFLAVAAAFMFEGNMNIAISSSLLVCFYVLFHFRKFSKKISYFLLAALLSFSIYAVRIIPFIDLISDASSRLSGQVGGWRISRIPVKDFLLYLIPKSHTFGTAIFSPGVMGILVSITGLIIAVKRRETRCLFPISLFVVGMLLITDTVFSRFIFSLPLMNKLTIIPSFITYITYSLAIFSAFLFEKWNRVKTIPYFLGILVFVEILIGYPTLGSETYTYNFKKMNRNEAKEFSLYKSISKLGPGLVYASEPYRFFVFPYAVSLNNLYFLNGYTYFFGSNLNKEISKYENITVEIIKDGVKNYYSFPKLDSQNLDEVLTKATYIISPFNLNNQHLVLMKEVAYTDIDSMKSDSVAKLMPDIRNLQLHGDWDGVLRIYESSYPKKSVKVLTNSNVKFNLDIKEENILDDGSVDTSINYSKWWKVNGDYKLKKDNLGYLNIQDVQNPKSIELTYQNPFIYLGFAVSIAAFIYVFWSLGIKREIAE